MYFTVTVTLGTIIPYIKLSAVCGVNNKYWRKCLSIRRILTQNKHKIKVKNLHTFGIFWDCQWRVNVSEQWLGEKCFASGRSSSAFWEKHPSDNDTLPANNMGCLDTTVWSENFMIISSLSPKRSVKWNDPYLPKEQVQTKDGTTQQKRHGNKVPVVGLNLEDGGNMAGTSIESWALKLRVSPVCNSRPMCHRAHSL